MGLENIAKRVGVVTKLSYRHAEFENEIQGGNKILRFFKSTQVEITWLSCFIKFIFRTNYF